MASTRIHPDRDPAEAGKARNGIGHAIPIGGRLRIGPTRTVAHHTHEADLNCFECRLPGPLPVIQMHAHGSTGGRSPRYEPSAHGIASVGGYFYEVAVGILAV